jgi:UTP-glucose-1-phosphate uridylyltransferase
VVVFGDTIITPPTYLRDLIGAHELIKRSDRTLAATVGVMKVKDVQRWGIVKLDSVKIGDYAKIVDLIEKPRPEMAPSDWAISGCYVFEPVIFDAIEETLRRPPGVRGEFQITDSMRILIEMGHSIFCVPLDVGHYDLGTLEDYVATFVEFALTHEHMGPAIRRRLREKKIL